MSSGPGPAPLNGPSALFAIGPHVIVGFPSPSLTATVDSATTCDSGFPLSPPLKDDAPDAERVELGAAAEAATALGGGEEEEEAVAALASTARTAQRMRSRDYAPPSEAAVRPRAADAAGPGPGGVQAPEEEVGDDEYVVDTQQGTSSTPAPAPVPVPVLIGGGGGRPPSPLEAAAAALSSRARPGAISIPVVVDAQALPSPTATLKQSRLAKITFGGAAASSSSSASRGGGGGGSRSTPSPAGSTPRPTHSAVASPHPVHPSSSAAGASGAGAGALAGGGDEAEAGSPRGPASLAVARRLSAGVRLPSLDGGAQTDQLAASGELKSVANPPVVSAGADPRPLIKQVTLPALLGAGAAGDDAGPRRAGAEPQPKATATLMQHSTSTEATVAAAASAGNLAPSFPPLDDDEAAGGLGLGGGVLWPPAGGGAEVPIGQLRGFGAALGLALPPGFKPGFGTQIMSTFAGGTREEEGGASGSGSMSGFRSIYEHDAAGISDALQARIAKAALGSRAFADGPPVGDGGGEWGGDVASPPLLSPPPVATAAPTVPVDVPATPLRLPSGTSNLPPLQILSPPPIGGPSTGWNDGGALRPPAGLSLAPELFAPLLDGLDAFDDDDDEDEDDDDEIDIVGVEGEDDSDGDGGGRSGGGSGGGGGGGGGSARTAVGDGADAAAAADSLATSPHFAGSGAAAARRASRVAIGGNPSPSSLLAPSLVVEVAAAAPPPLSSIAADTPAALSPTVVPASAGGAPETRRGGGRKGQSRGVYLTKTGALRLDGFIVKDVGIVAYPPDEGGDGGGGADSAGRGPGSSSASPGPRFAPYHGPGSSADAAPVSSNGLSTASFKDTCARVEVLGHGASGWVYKVVHVPTLTLLAAKVVPIFNKEKRHAVHKELLALHANRTPFKSLVQAAAGAVGTLAKGVLGNTSGASAGAGAGAMSRASSSVDGGTDGGGAGAAAALAAAASAQAAAESVSGSAPCPYLVTFFDAFYDAEVGEGQLVFVTEYMDGGSLQDILDKGGDKGKPQPHPQPQQQGTGGGAGAGAGEAAPAAVVSPPRGDGGAGGMSESVLAKIAWSVLRGLAFLHRRRIIHRDIKPSNLLINHLGDVKIADFGIIRDLQDGEEFARTFTGTLTYMSPERVLGLPYSLNSDVWSAGLSVLACALGRDPYDGSIGYWELMTKLQGEEMPPLPPSDRYSPAFFDFLAQSLQKDPSARPSAAALLDHPFLARPRAKAARVERAARAAAEAAATAAHLAREAAARGDAVEAAAQAAVAADAAARAANVSGGRAPLPQQQQQAPLPPLSRGAVQDLVDIIKKVQEYRYRAALRKGISRLPLIPPARIAHLAAQLGLPEAVAAGLCARAQAKYEAKLALVRERVIKELLAQGWAPGMALPPPPPPGGAGEGGGGNR
jgi:serine/threonine protein kinase